MYLNPCTFSLISTKIKIHQPQCILFSDQNALISTTIRYTKEISGQLLRALKRLGHVDAVDLDSHNEVDDDREQDNEQD